MSLSPTTTHVHCPCAAEDRCWTAHVVADHSEQGWVRLCNGVIVFDDHWFLTPDGRSALIPLAA